MANVNKFICVGNICKDLETSYLQDGTCICKFTIITSEKYKGEEQVEFTNFVAFGKAGENIAKYCVKGSQLYVESKKKTRKYEDKYYTDFIVLSFQFLGRGKKEQVPDNQNFNQQSGGFNTPPRDDIPF